MRRFHPLLFIALIAGAPSPVSSDTTRKSARACFWSSEVTGFTDAGPDRAILNIGARESWELTLSPGCPDVDWALRISVRARGGERICTGRPVELLVPEPGGRSRACLVRSVRLLSGEEAAAATARMAGR
jgi:hypothetical protein